MAAIGARDQDLGSGDFHGGILLAGGRMSQETARQLPEAVSNSKGT
jgi:hypothetical protein